MWGAAWAEVLIVGMRWRAAETGGGHVGMWCCTLRR